MRAAIGTEYHKYHDPCDVCRYGCEEDAEVNRQQTFDAVKHSNSGADDGHNGDTQEGAKHPLGNW